MSIRLEHVSYAYEDNSSKKNYALKDVNLEIKKEEFIAVIGHTGSGKSTLIQHLNGLIKPTSGTIYFDDEDIYSEGYPLRELRGKVGICFQYPEHQLFETTILDDVCFGPMNFGKTKEEATEIAVKCLKDVGLPEKLYQKSPFELSGGQKRRVAIAGILAMEPEYFILDEPTAGLDPVGKDQILNLLKKLHEEKKITIILVSHSMEDVADYAQRVIVMNGGQVMYEGDKKEVFSHKKELEEAGLAVPFYRQVCEELADRGFPIQRDLLTLEETKEAILELQKKGIPVAIASGRPTKGIVAVADELDFAEYGSYVLAFNGARIINWKTKECIYSKELPIGIPKKLYDDAMHYGTGLMTYEGDSIISAKIPDEYIMIESRITTLPVIKKPDFKSYVNFPVNKCILTADGELLESIEPVIAEKYQLEAQVFRSEPYFLEVLPKNVDKAYCLERLLKILGIEREEMVCCGDGFNDISMIQYAGLGVAMANAQEKVKDVADYITINSNDEDGIAEVIEKFFLK